MEGKLKQIENEKQWNNARIENWYSRPWEFENNMKKILKKHLNVNI